MARGANKKKRSSSGAVELVDASVLEKLREEAEEQLRQDRQRKGGKKGRNERKDEVSEDSDVEMESEPQEEDVMDDTDLLAAAAASDELKAIRERQAKYFPNNTAAMEQALALMEFKAPSGSAVPWVETLSLTSSFDHSEVDATDDFTRELSFYRQAVDCCEQAAEQFEQLGLKYRRPEDYFAEMLKTDAHMTKVRKNLLEQRQRIEAVEERRQQREMKKFGKQVQVAKEQARAKQRKQETDAIKKWRTTQKDADGINVERTKEEFDVMLDATAPEKADKKNAMEVANAEKKSEEPLKPRVNLKRKRKDEKYGFGGKKKRIKSNTRESTDATTEWSRAKNNAVDKDILRLVPKVGNQRAKKEQMLKRLQKKKRR